ncbi:aldo/keto reductase [bacterium]|nr:aldo/keto reductase [bacterium]
MTESSEKTKAAESDCETSKRMLGKTDIRLAPVGLGCWPIAGMTSLNVNDQDSIRTVQMALDNGINMLDTAYGYGADGQSDRLIRKSIAGRREQVVIASKAGMHWKPDGNRCFDASPGRIIQECEESLLRLGVEAIDLFYLHAVDPNIPIQESAKAFASLLSQGKIRSVGVSNVTAEQLILFDAVCEVAAVQPPFNMLQRQIETDLIPLCLERSISVINYWPLMKGLLAGKIRRGHEFDPADKRLTYDVFQGEQFEQAQTLLDGVEKIANEIDKTVAQVVVNWTIHRPGITATLCGAKRDWQILETAGAMGWRLDDSQIEKIDRLLA